MYSKATDPRLKPTSPRLIYIVLLKIRGMPFAQTYVEQNKKQK